MPLCTPLPHPNTQGVMLVLGEATVTTARSLLDLPHSRAVQYFITGKWSAMFVRRWCGRRCHAAHCNTTMPA